MDVVADLVADVVVVTVVDVVVIGIAMVVVGQLWTLFSCGKRYRPDCREYYYFSFTCD